MTGKEIGTEWLGKCQIQDPNPNKVIAEPKL